jgi:hypothetical protein
MKNFQAKAISWIIIGNSPNRNNPAHMIAIKPQAESSWV